MTNDREEKGSSFVAITDIYLCINKFTTMLVHVSSVSEASKNKAANAVQLMFG